MKTHLYTPSALHERLEALGVQAKKGLSQNFLIDGNIIRKILAASGVKAGDTVIEIGPGPGALTEALLQAGAHVIAIEKDPTFARGLTPHDHLTVIEADVLEVSLLEILKERKGKAKVIANLPYHITTPIISRFVPLRDHISSLTVMVQKEVGDRMTAKAGTPEYGSLTVFLDYYAKTTYAFTVSPNCFFPRPKVHSAVVHLELKTPETPVNEEQFFAFTRATFQMRRKMLRASLKETYSPEALSNAFEKTAISPEARPETLSLQNFLRLFAALNSLKLSKN
jgi:16S rRNA (adenine1518-N6/adenine1519-N6)-dimethyltransferase